MTTLILPMRGPDRIVANAAHRLFRWRLGQCSVDPEEAEYFVRVEWLDSVPESEAFDEVGLFGSQHTVCRPSTPKWRHTVERLKTMFRNWDRPQR